MSAETPKYPGLPAVINGNGAVAHVMQHVCGGVIGFPITPSTEIAELFEAARAEGQLNVWGKHPFFVETEGEHSAQSGALGAALVGGQFISNASSAQGVLYALESHYVTAGRKIGGFVLQVAARVVTKHSLNVMAGHDDVYTLLPAGYTVLFASDPQEAADFAAIGFRVSSLSLIPVANAFDGFATSHVMSEVLLPEPELLKEFLGDPAGRIACPTVAQEILFGAKGRVDQLERFLDRHAGDFDPDGARQARDWLKTHARAVEADADGVLAQRTHQFVPEDLRAAWRRAWRGAAPQGTRQLVPALVDPDNPGLTGPVQNQADFQAGAADHRAHFANAVPALARQAMDEWAALTGRRYAPVLRYGDIDADYVVVGLGSITDDARAILPYLQSQGIKAAVVSIKQLHPFPTAGLVAALHGARGVTVLERSDDTALTRLTTQALFQSGISARDLRLTTAIFGLGSHDVQPRHLIAAFRHMMTEGEAPLIYLGSQFFAERPASASLQALQSRLRQAYPETEAMALPTGDNPPGLLPASALRLRFHSVGGYGTVATGKLLTDILAGMLGLHSKSAPKYGSEKSGAATNFYLTLSPEPILLTNAQLEDVEVVVSPDHKAFFHDRPLRGLVQEGTFILQSSHEPLEVWRSLPKAARAMIREKRIHFYVIDAFAVAKKHAPSPSLETRMMGIAFIGAVIGHVDRIQQAAGGRNIHDLVQHEITKKFGAKGPAVVKANLAVIEDGIKATHRLNYDAPEFLAVDAAPEPGQRRALSSALVPAAGAAAPSALFDAAYFDEMMGRPFREGTIGESPVLPGIGLFMPPASGAAKDKGLFRRTVPVFDPAACTACLECAVACPDSAIPNQAHELYDLLVAAIDAVTDISGPQRAALKGLAVPWAGAIQRRLVADRALCDIAALARASAADLEPGETGERALARHLDSVIVALAQFPVARPRPIFDQPEKKAPGTGGLYSVVIDPWKCTGCLQCVAVCGPGALRAVDQTDELQEELEATFERLTRLPKTPRRFTADALKPGGDTKRLLLDHSHYYALTGGHGACRGCGEVTATHLVTALSHAVAEERRQARVAELESLTGQLAAKLAEIDRTEPPPRPMSPPIGRSVVAERRERVAQALATLEQALFRVEGGPTAAVIANSTGCSSVYASTMPAQPFTDPWVNSLFQDTSAVAVGMFEGLVAHHLDVVKATRIAQLELADSFDAAAAARLATLSWRDLSVAELAQLPVVLTIGGDGSVFDIGFAAVSRVLTSRTPVKMLVLDTGGYSNTGGQTSTASFTGQDADLSRFGRAHAGKVETRKELGILAALHPGAFAAHCAAAFHGHFLATIGRFLSYSEGTSLLQVYTPCDFEQGFADDQANARSRLAVESRMAPLFVHDPRDGATLSERLSLEGNPDLDQPWTTRTLQAVDEHGSTTLVTTPLTPAEFALGEVRFRKHFHPLPPDAPGAVPIAEYVTLAPAARAGKTPFVLDTDDDLRLKKVTVSPTIVELVEERQRNWQQLRFFAGRDAARLERDHAEALAALVAERAQAAEARDHVVDEIAEALAKLATAKDPATVPLPFVDAGPAAPAGGVAAVSAPAPVTTTPGAAVGPAATPAAGTSATGVTPSAGAGVDAAPVTSPASPLGLGPKPAGAPIWLAAEDLPKCTDCGTCYQDLPQLFERATILVDGQALQVSRMKEGALDALGPVTEELAARMDRVRDSCDSEIIQ